MTQDHLAEDGRTARAGFTAGPWQIDWNVSRLDIYAESGFRVATLHRSTKDGAPTHDDAEAIANARLIAAAPKLLEALIAFRDGGPSGGQDFRQWHSSYSPAIEKARAALAAAGVSALPKEG